jgi:hypothetical protein
MSAVEVEGGRRFTRQLVKSHMITHLIYRHPVNVHVDIIINFSSYSFSFATTTDSVMSKIERGLK